MEITKIRTWPSELIFFFDENYKYFIGWECVGEKEPPYESYDIKVSELNNILRKYNIPGYHCTRLTENEISHIRRNGMQLQNETTLISRIDSIDDKILEPKIKEKLKSENQSDDFNRKHKLWFCSFEPKHAGQHGIQRFFRSWGGEALYNSHEREDETGIALRNIGIPCIIEASIPMNLIPNTSLPYGQVTRVYLENKGYELENPCDFEGYIENNLNADFIIEIHQYPSEKFLRLTDCEKWDNTRI